MPGKKLSTQLGKDCSEQNKELTNPTHLWHHTENENALQNALKLSAFHKSCPDNFYNVWTESTGMAKHILNWGGGGARSEPWSYQCIGGFGRILPQKILKFWSSEMPPSLFHFFIFCLNLGEGRGQWAEAPPAPPAPPSLENPGGTNIYTFYPMMSLAPEIIITCIHLYSFLPHTVRDWHGLPNEVVFVPSLVLWNIDFVY